MSSFYDDASLVMIPSGYKNAKIYCEKPTDGSGDLTFTRASSATRVASNGLIEKVRTNLILQSNTFSTTWANLNSSETSGQPDKDGGNTAWKLVGDTTNGRHYLFQTVAGAPTEVTLSIYAKASGHNFIQLASAQNTDEYTNFDLSDGTIGTVGTSFSSAQIQSVGNGWYRISATRTNGGINGFYISLVSSKTAGWLEIWAMPNNTDGFLIQNAQLESGVLTDFIGNTTSAAVSVGPVSGLPRLDYLNSSCPRLLLEPQRSNTVTYSEQFDNAAWTKIQSSITANAAVSPDGYSSADKFIPNTSNVIHAIANTITSVSASWTYSIFAKAAGYDRVVINTFNTNYVGFNLTTGVIESSLGTGITSANIENYGNGWYRCSITSTSTASGANVAVSIFNAAYTNGNVNPTFSGNGTDGVLLWGAQIEAGAYATSYIPTLATSVTRVVDVCSKTGISSLIGQTQGTLFAEVEFDTNSTDLVNRIFSVTDGTTTSRILMCANTDETFRFIVSVAAATVVNITTSASIFGGRHKVAFAYKANDFIAYVDGVQVGSNTAVSSVPASLTAAYIGTVEGGASSQILEGTVSQALLFKTRLTNAQLAELTTL